MQSHSIFSFDWNLINQLPTLVHAIDKMKVHIYGPYNAKRLDYADVFCNINTNIYTIDVPDICAQKWFEF